MNNAENIKQMLEQLYSDRNQNGDVIFIVGSEQIRAHRNVLAAFSPKFKSQFYGPNPDQGEIRIPNVSAAAFKEFLQFFYKESVELTMSNIESVLDLAKQSLVDGFVDICIDFLKKSITPNNMCFVYRLAIIYDIESLRFGCERQISTKTMEIFTSEDFVQCNRDVLLNILNLDAFNCPEIGVFKACIAWAQADCRRKDLDEKKPEHLSAALGDAIHLIRFSSINAQELAAALHGSLNGFFTGDELLELFSITSKVKDFTSRKFNQTPRIQPEDHVKFFTGSQLWSLECNRFEYIIKDHLNTNSHLHSEIHCDKPIRLYGLVLGFHFKESCLNYFKSHGKFKVSIERENEIRQYILQKCKYYEGQKEIIIIFDEPIERLKFFETDFPQSRFQINYKLVLSDQVVVDNNKFTCSGELIKGFFFDNI